MKQMPARDQQEPNAGPQKCGNCGSVRVRTGLGEDRFKYGDGPDSVMLTTPVTVVICDDCGMEYLGPDAELARHESVCSHLLLLTPKQLTALRKMHEFNLPAFAKLTRLGVASLRRWESGRSLQNGAIDDYLWLLGFDDNITRLQERRASKTALLPEERKMPEFRTFKVTREILETSKSQFELSR